MREGGGEGRGKREEGRGDEGGRRGGEWRGVEGGREREEEGRKRGVKSRV